MNDTIWNLSLTDFKEKIASNSPTPGGGSVTIVCGVFGVSLIIMALEVSLRSIKEQLLNQKATDLLLELRSKMSHLSALADTDIIVFNKLMESFKLPKKTEAEQQTRNSSIKKSLYEATLSPIQAAETLDEILSLAEECVELINRNIISDIEAGVILLRAAIEGVLLNVDINLANLEIEKKSIFTIKRQQISNSGEIKTKKINNLIREKFTK